DHVQRALHRTAEPLNQPAESFSSYVDDVLASARRGEVADAYARVMESAEKELFTRAIKEAQGNQARAARWLGISRITMKSKLLHFGLHPSQEDEEQGSVVE